MSLVQLIYVSDLVRTDESEIPAILESSVRHNNRNGITGMLLYSWGNFLQVLEGKKEAVDETYGRIAKDPRHHNIIFLTEDNVEDRHFANWSMGYLQLGAEHVAKVPQYAPFFQYGFKADTIKAKPGVALEMLKLFSQGLL